LALDMAHAVDAPPRTALDLGTGAGIPGLVLALHWPESRWVLLDANQRRSLFVNDVVQRQLPAVGKRVRVCHERAEVAGHRPELRRRFELVVARGFGPPAVTAECGAPFLEVGGVLVVAEPPGGAPDRWPRDGLARAGLELDAFGGTVGSWVRLCQRVVCPDELPRRTGLPAKRPLFGGDG
jgi:16S rRNA (guanine527-N7)-methyltransferase